MAIIRQLGERLNSHYIQPTLVQRSAARLIAQSYGQAPSQPVPRRAVDRRCNRDRRQQQQQVLLDLRSPHARRNKGRRSSDPGYAITGIDVYA